MTDTAVPAADTSKPIRTDWPEMLTSRDLAEFLQVHPNAPAEWRNERRTNQPRYIRIGALIRYRLADVRAWIDANAAPAAA